MREEITQGAVSLSVEAGKMTASLLPTVMMNQDLFRPQ